MSLNSPKFSAKRENLASDLTRMAQEARAPQSRSPDQPSVDLPAEDAIRKQFSVEFQAPEHGLHSEARAGRSHTRSPSTRARSSPPVSGPRSFEMDVQRQHLLERQAQMTEQDEPIEKNNSKSSKSRSPSPGDRHGYLEMAGDFPQLPEHSDSEEEPVPFRDGKGRRDTVFIPPAKPTASTPSDWYARVARDERGIMGASEPGDILNVLVDWSNCEEQFYKKHRSKPTTPSDAFSIIEKDHADMAESLLALSTERGRQFLLKSNALLLKITSSLGIHPRQASAIMLYVMSSRKESTRRAKVCSVIRAYMLADDYQTDQYLENCKQGIIPTFMYDEASLMKSLAEAPGVLRLTPGTNSVHVSRAWQDLFYGMQDVMGFTPIPDYDVTQLLTNFSKAYRQRHYEDLQDVLSRLEKTFITLVEACRITDQKSRIPTETDYVVILKSVVRDSLMSEAQLELQNPSLHPEGTDMEKIRRDPLIKALRTAEVRLAKKGVLPRSNDQKSARQARGKPKDRADRSSQRSSWRQEKDTETGAQQRHSPRSPAKLQPKTSTRQYDTAPERKPKLDGRTYSCRTCNETHTLPAGHKKGEGQYAFKTADGKINTWPCLKNQEDQASSLLSKVLEKKKNVQAARQNLQELPAHHVHVTKLVHHAAGTPDRRVESPPPHQRSEHDSDGISDDDSDMAQNAAGTPDKGAQMPIKMKDAAEEARSQVELENSEILLTPAPEMQAQDYFPTPEAMAATPPSLHGIDEFPEIETPNFLEPHFLKRPSPLTHSGILGSELVDPSLIRTRRAALSDTPSRVRRLGETGWQEESMSPPETLDEAQIRGKRIMEEGSLGSPDPASPGAAPRQCPEPRTKYFAWPIRRANLQADEDRLILCGEEILDGMQAPPKCADRSAPSPAWWDSENDVSYAGAVSPTAGMEGETLTDPGHQWTHQHCVETTHVAEQEYPQPPGQCTLPKASVSSQALESLWRVQELKQQLILCTDVVSLGLLMAASKILCNGILESEWVFYTRRRILELAKLLIQEEDTLIEHVFWPYPVLPPGQAYPPDMATLYPQAIIIQLAPTKRDPYNSEVYPSQSTQYAINLANQHQAFLIVHFGMQTYVRLLRLLTLIHARDGIVRYALITDTKVFISFVSLDFHHADGEEDTSVDSKCINRVPLEMEYVTQYCTPSEVEPPAARRPATSWTQEHPQADWYDHIDHPQIWGVSLTSLAIHPDIFLTRHVRGSNYIKFRSLMTNKCCHIFCDRQAARLPQDTILDHGLKAMRHQASLLADEADFDTLPLTCERCVSTTSAMCAALGGACEGPMREGTGVTIQMYSHYTGITRVDPAGVPRGTVSISRHDPFYNTKLRRTKWGASHDFEISALAASYAGTTRLFERDIQVMQRMLDMRIPVEITTPQFHEVIPGPGELDEWTTGPTMLVVHAANKGRTFVATEHLNIPKEVMAVLMHVGVTITRNRNGAMGYNIGKAKVNLLTHQVVASMAAPSASPVLPGPLVLGPEPETSSSVAVKFLPPDTAAKMASMAGMFLGEPLQKHPTYKDPHTGLPTPLPITMPSDPVEVAKWLSLTMLSHGSSTVTTEGRKIIFNGAELQSPPPPSPIPPDEERLMFGGKQLEDGSSQSSLDMAGLEDIMDFETPFNYDEGNQIAGPNPGWWYNPATRPPIVLSADHPVDPIPQMPALLSQVPLQNEHTSGYPMLYCNSSESGTIPIDIPAAPSSAPSHNQQGFGHQWADHLDDFAEVPLCPQHLGKCDFPQCKEDVVNPDPHVSGLKLCDPCRLKYIAMQPSTVKQCCVEQCQNPAELLEDLLTPIHGFCSSCWNYYNMRVDCLIPKYDVFVSMAGEIATVQISNVMKKTQMLHALAEKSEQYQHSPDEIIFTFGGKVITNGVELGQYGLRPYSTIFASRRCYGGVRPLQQMTVSERTDQVIASITAKSEIETMYEKAKECFQTYLDVDFMAAMEVISGNEPAIPLALKRLTTQLMITGLTETTIADTIGHFLCLLASYLYDKSEICKDHPCLAAHAGSRGQHGLDETIPSPMPMNIPDTCELQMQLMSMHDDAIEQWSGVCPTVHRKYAATQEQMMVASMRALLTLGVTPTALAAMDVLKLLVCNTPAAEFNRFLAGLSTSYGLLTKIVEARHGIQTSGLTEFMCEINPEHRAISEVEANNVQVLTSLLQAGVAAQTPQQTSGVTSPSLSNQEGWRSSLVTAYVHLNITTMSIYAADPGHEKRLWTLVRREPQQRNELETMSGLVGLPRALLLGHTRNEYVWSLRPFATAAFGWLREHAAIKRSKTPPYQAKDQGEDCILCGDEFDNALDADGQACNPRHTLQCGHNLFHADCLVRHAVANGELLQNCPICRATVLPQDLPSQCETVMNTLLLSTASSAMQDAEWHRELAEYEEDDIMNAYGTEDGHLSEDEIPYFLANLERAADMRTYSSEQEDAAEQEIHDNNMRVAIANSEATAAAENARHQMLDLCGDSHLPCDPCAAEEENQPGADHPPAEEAMTNTSEQDTSPLQSRTDSNPSRFTHLYPNPRLSTKDVPMTLERSDERNIYHHTPCAPEKPTDAITCVSRAANVASTSHCRLPTDQSVNGQPINHDTWRPDDDLGTRVSGTPIRGTTHAVSPVSHPIPSCRVYPMRTSRPDHIPFNPGRGRLRTLQQLTAKAESRTQELCLGGEDHGEEILALHSAVQELFPQDSPLILAARFEMAANPTLDFTECIATVTNYPERNGRMRKQRLKHQAFKFAVFMSLPELGMSPSTLYNLQPSQSDVRGGGYRVSQAKVESTDDDNQWTEAEDRAFLAGLTVFDDKGRSMIMGIDSYAEVSLIHPKAVDPEWKITQSEGCELEGIGDPSPAGKQVSVPVSFRWAMKPVHIRARIRVPPDGVTLLVGIPATRILNAIIDIPNDRLFIGVLSLEVDTEPVIILVERQKLRPLRVLSLCGGMDATYGTLRELGYRIEIYHSVEINPTARKVAAALVPQIEHIAHDVKELTAQHLNQYKYSLLSAGPPCTPWSRGSDNPKGFHDPHADVFIHIAAIKEWALQANPQCLFMGETVIPHLSLLSEANIQNQIMKTDALTLQAVDQGSLSSRVRRWFVPYANAEPPQRPPRSVQRFLGPNAAPFHKDNRFPCVMAQMITHNIPRYKTLSGTVVVLDMDGLDAIQGYAEGASVGGYAPYCGGPVNIDRVERHRIIGGSFNSWQFAALARLFPLRPKPHIQVWPAARQHTSLDALETSLMTMDNAALRAYFEDILEGYSPPQLFIEPANSDAVPYQAKSGYENPKDVEYIEQELERQCQLGIIEHWHYSPNSLISPIFGKKKNRIDEQGNPVYRILWDMRACNGALKRHPDYWLFAMPTIEGVMLDIPADAEYFCQVDIEDAFPGVKCQEKSRYLLCGVYNRKHYRCIGCPQGLAPIAPFYNVHLNDCFNHALHQHWSSMWSTFVDDVIVFSKHEERTQLRKRVLITILEVLGKTVSQKNDMAIKKAVDIVGITVSKGGNKLSQAGIDALTYTMSVRPRSKDMVRHMLGVILYSCTAFEWVPGRLSWVGELLHPVRETLKLPRFKWSDECSANIKTLMEHIPNAPLRLKSPNSLLTMESSFAIKHDASDHCYGYALVWVNIPCAEDITLEHLQDPAVSQLIDVRSKVIKKERADWPTWEKELNGKVAAAIRYGHLILTALIALASSQNTTPDKLPVKVIFLGDSTTADTKWNSLFIPEEIKFITAKYTRFMSWIAKVSYWENIPHLMAHCPGSLNSLAHVLSHIATQLKEIEQARRSKTPPHVYPITVHSYYGPKQERTITTPPEGFTVHSLPLSSADVEEIARALMADDKSTVNGVFLNQLYTEMLRLVGPAETAKELSETNPEVARKVAAWSGKRFFLFNTLSEAVPLLYTQASVQRLLDFDQHNLGEDMTKILVLVIPDKARVTLTAAESLVHQDLEAAPHYTDWYLRQHIMYASHDVYTPHTSRSETERLVARKAYWPSLTNDVRKYVDDCEACIPYYSLTPHVGNQVISLQRFGVLQMDHKVLSNCQENACGFKAILMMGDPGTRYVIASKVPSEDAVTTAFTIFTQWIPHFGIPYLIQSDPKSNLTSKVIESLMEILGVRDWNHGAVGAAWHQGFIEHANIIMGKSLDLAYSRGDLATPRGLDMAIAHALTILNQHEADADGTSAFQRKTGQRPRTLSDVMLISSEHNPTVAVEKDIDCQFLSMLSNHVSDIMSMYRSKLEGKARKEILNKEYKNAQKSTITCEFEAGDKVAYNGLVYEIYKVDAPQTGQPISAHISRELVNGEKEIKKVQHSQLLPLGVSKHTHKFPVNMVNPDPVAQDEFIIFEKRKRHSLRSCNSP